MERKILFRGKQIDALPENIHLNGRWIEGYLADKNYIHSPKLKGVYLVDTETVCQYTGTPDKNGKKIYDGDIVRRKLFEEYIIGEVVWQGIGVCGFYLKCGNKYYPIGKDEYVEMSSCDEVIGNIFDNLELLKEVEKNG